MDDYSGLPAWLQVTVMGVLGGLVILGAAVKFVQERWPSKPSAISTDVASIGISLNDSHALGAIADAITSSGKKNVDQLKELGDQVEKLRRSIEEFAHIFKMAMGVQPWPVRPPPSAPPEGRTR